MAEHHKKIILVGGGTGGHVVPILEVYKKLKSLDTDLEIIVVGSKGSVERQFYNEIPTYRKIRSGKLRRHLTLRNIGELLNFAIGCLQSTYLILSQKPALIFAKGGFVSLPVVLAARFIKIPYFIHESDIEMGMVNKIAQKGAAKIFLGFPPENYSGLAKDKVVFSGPIIRSNLREQQSGKREVFGFDNKPVIFVTGGSQGALHLNKTVAKILPKLLVDYNIIHQAGEHSMGWMESFRQSLPLEARNSYYLIDFLKVEGGIDKMVEAINLADLVITRAGANTLAELAIKGKAMILVPYKHASGDHQLKNARLLEAADAAAVIIDDDLQPKLLLEKISTLFADNGRELKELAINAKKFFESDGLEIVSQAIIDELKK